MSDDDDELMSLKRQYELAEEFDRLYPPTVAWHQACINVLKRVRGLSDDSRQALIRRHLDAIEAIKAKETDDGR